MTMADLLWILTVYRTKLNAKLAHFKKEIQIYLLLKIHSYF